MSSLVKLIEDISIKDLEEFPVWQYINDDSIGETAVRSVKKIPVKSTTGKIFGVKVSMANHQKIWAMIQNVDATNWRLTNLFLTIALEYNEKWFPLARYFDFDYEQYNPNAFANLLKMEVDEIFPITYDITSYAIGEKSALSGKVLKEPKEKLTRSEIIALAIP